VNRWTRIFVAALTTLSVIPAAALIATSTASPASAETNGVGQKPAMGWSTWSFLRGDPTEAAVEADAKAMVTSGLKSVGYQYVNLDDFWYNCPGSQGPDVDQYGRWTINTSRFPSQGSENGIQATANYIHHLGLKFGLYMTPGISAQAVAENTPIEGTDYTADEIAEPTDHENNYNCGGMVGINYSAPGAQQFIDSWADEFASWGVDYLKLDGVGSFDIPDVEAWSNALRQTGRPIHLELSNSLNINDASTWEEYANGWRTGGDIECYCGTNGSSYPLTDWSNVESRFNQVAEWQPYGEPGAYNDYDSIEVGNGTNDGLTYDQRQTQLSLWSLASSPLLLGTDLTNLDKQDLALLKNRQVIAVDQDGIDASRLTDTSSEQIFAKTEKAGDVAAGLFNTSGSTETITTSAAALGLPAGTDYTINNLWTHKTTETTGTISEAVPSDGVALLKVTATRNPVAAPPAGVVSVSGQTALSSGTPATITESFTNNGPVPALGVRMRLNAPSGWTVTPADDRAGNVASGATVNASFTVTPPSTTELFDSATLNADASYLWARGAPQQVAVSYSVTDSPPVEKPYETYSSATDAASSFGQEGQQFGISGAGADLYSGTDAYSTIYDPGAVGSTATLETEVTATSNLTGYGKAGIIVRNSMTGSGTSPEGVILFESPEGGIQLEWDNNGGDYIDTVTPSNGTNPELTPVWLELVRDGDSYTGYYSFDGTGWLPVGTATVSGQNVTQDGGMFVTSHDAGVPAQATFDGFTVTGTDTAPAAATAYLAVDGTLAGQAVVTSCTTCYGGEYVGYVGEGGTVTVTVNVPTAGTYPVTLVYCDGSSTGRQADISVNGGASTLLSFTPTGSFSTIGAMTVSETLNAGSNTIEIGNPSAYAPNFNEVIVG
jgi:Alpha galactosidase A/NPCBM-associated, NEW3 domain of alpha-galactosidase/Alpha galactosidase C-terminal beta sandwich domain/Carbohydrate binding module (family 35)